MQSHHYGERAKALNHKVIPFRTLSMSIGSKMERAMGIEPTCEAWKASVLPLNYARTEGNTNCSPRIVNQAQTC